jgi:hypothetical protein
MRIVYKDITKEFRQLLQGCQNQKDSIACIQVTQSELTQILKHLDGPQLLPDYFQRRQVRLDEIARERLQLKHDLERAVGDAAREAIYNKDSDLELEAHNITEKVPREITQNGVLIKVVMKA